MSCIPCNIAPLPRHTNQPFPNQVDIQGEDTSMLCLIVELRSRTKGYCIRMALMWHLYIDAGHFLGTEANVIIILCPVGVHG